MVQASVIELRPGREYRVAYVDPEGVLVVELKTRSWWVEVYGRVAEPPRVDAEDAPYAEVRGAVSAHRELSLWAMGVP